MSKRGRESNRPKTAQPGRRRGRPFDLDTELGRQAVDDVVRDPKTTFSRDAAAVIVAANVLERGDVAAFFDANPKLGRFGLSQGGGHGDAKKAASAKRVGARADVLRKSSSAKGDLNSDLSRELGRRAWLDLQRPEPPLSSKAHVEHVGFDGHGLVDVVCGPCECLHRRCDDCGRVYPHASYVGHLARMWGMTISALGETPSRLRCLDIEFCRMARLEEKPDDKTDDVTSTTPSREESSPGK